MRYAQKSAPDLAAGIFVVALGGLALWQAAVIPASPLYAQVGPRLVPYLVAACLVLLGAGLVLSALRGGWSAALPEVAEAPPADLRALGLLLAGLLANLVLIGPLGFTLAATVQFALVAAAFGSRNLLRDLVIAFIVSLSAWLLFVRLLGVNIGAGIVEEFLGRLLGGPG
jgi:putative tricarboxylic transport membrane protein